MTGAEFIAAAGPYVAPVIVALGGLYGMHLKSKRAEADRIADRDKTQAEHAEWLRDTVETQIAEAKADRARERAECTERLDAQQQTIDALQARDEERNGLIDALRAEVESLRRLAQRLAELVAQIDPYKTPTPAQMDALKETAAKMGLRPSVAPSLVIARGGAK